MIARTLFGHTMGRVYNYGNYRAWTLTARRSCRAPYCMTVEGSRNNHLNSWYSPAKGRRGKWQWENGRSRDYRRDIHTVMSQRRWRNYKTDHATVKGADARFAVIGMPTNAVYEKGLHDELRTGTNSVGRAKGASRGWRTEDSEVLFVRKTLRPKRRIGKPLLSRALWRLLGHHSTLCGLWHRDTSELLETIKRLFTFRTVKRG